MAFELKRLSRSSLDAAMQKAAHYRDLNQPEEAESICLDVLVVEPLHQMALKLLGLALTDRFASGRVGLLEQSLEVFGKLTDAYERTYHMGVAWERAAKAHLERNEAHNAAAAFERALRHYEEAESLGPGSPDPLLRWNRCVRLLAQNPALRDAVHEPRESQPHLGD